MDRVWCPFATRRPLDPSDGPDYGGTLTDSRGLILHVQVGHNSPAPWFDRPEVQASSHWWVGYDGLLVQMVPADRQAWAQAAGNASWHSVETEGDPSERLTDAQIGTLGALYRWGADWWSWPLRVADEPDGPMAFGLGIHSMGGAAWGNHPGCPGPVRAAQRRAILDAARGLTTGDDVADIQTALNDATAEGYRGYSDMFKAKPGGIVDMLRSVFDRSKRVEAAVTDLAGKQAVMNAALNTLVDPQHPAATALSDPTADLVLRVAGLNLPDAVLVAHAATSRVAALVPPTAPPTGGTS